MKLKLILTGLLLAGVVGVAGVAGAAERDQIRVVGSSTVYPFSTKVAERFGKTTKFKTPVVESTGSGGGLKLFCAGVGTEHPDITNASRAIKSSEVELCHQNGVKEIVEINIGFDGIVLAQSKDAELLDLSLKQIYLALAKDVPTDDGKLRPNTNQTWNQIDPKLPNVKIEVLGPPPTSGTRDAFVELAMEGGCKSWDWIKDLKKKDKKRYKGICHGIREDGAFIEAGENDNLIVQKLAANKAAVGIFGFSFLDQNLDKIQGASIGGVTPSFDSIADQSYPVSRPLFFYVKKAHSGVVPGVGEFVNAFTSDQATGEDGYLADLGLIPLPAADRAKVKADGRNLTNNVQ